MSSGVDVFVSYTDADRAWAEWIAWQLESAGLTTLLQAWDFSAGQDWAHEMHRAAATARRTLAVLSADYLESAHGEAEWRVAYALDPSGEAQRLVPVRVDASEPTGLLRTRLFVDLVGLDADTARVRLLAAFRPAGGRLKPKSAPSFPGSGPAQPRFPGPSADAPARPEPVRRYSPRLWLTTVATVVAFGSAMFTLRESPSQTGPRPTPSPEAATSALKAAPSPSETAGASAPAPPAVRGPAGAAANASSGANPSVGAVCRQLSRDDALRVSDIRKLRARLRKAGTGYDQTEAARGVLNRMKERSLGALAAFDAATAEDAQRVVDPAWNHGLDVVRTFSEQLGAATTYEDLVVAGRRYGSQLRGLDDDWRRVSVGLQRLGGRACGPRRREAAPSVRLRGPASGALHTVSLDVPYDTTVFIGSPLDIVDPSTGALPGKSARKPAGGGGGGNGGAPSNSTTAPPVNNAPLPPRIRPTVTPFPPISPPITAREG